MKSINFEAFEKATRKDLRERARECFEIAQDGRATPEMSIAYLSEAQFYMSEMDRRSDSRIAWRDLVLEFVVIVLIGAEIALAVKQGKDEDILMDKQNGILTSLQKSTADNASSITALAVVTKAMSDMTAASGKTLTSVDKGVQSQISLFYDPSMSMMYAQDQSRILFNNTGRSSLKVNAVKVDGQAKNFLGTKLIAVGSSMYLEVEEQSKSILAALAKGSARIVPVEAHVENELGKHFVLNGALFFVWENDKVVVHGQTISLQSEP